MLEKRILIDDVETNYSIDELGRIKNIKTMNYLKGIENKGYLCLNIFVRGKAHLCYIHRLVAETFLPNPENKSIVHHKDGNKLNNNLNNLEWVSQEEHIKYRQKIVSKNPIYLSGNEDLGAGVFFRNTRYFITEDGRVINSLTKRVLSLEKTGKYYRVMLYLPEGKKRFSVHRLVWEAFNGEIDNKLDIHHIDGNPANNSISNLQQISHKENCRKAQHGQFTIKRTLPDGTEIIYRSLRDAAKEAHKGHETIRKYLEAIEPLSNGEVWEKV